MFQEGMRELHGPLMRDAVLFFNLGNAGGFVLAMLASTRHDIVITKDGN
jgi:hypothetical protein